MNSIQLQLVIVALVLINCFCDAQFTPLEIATIGQGRGGGRLARRFTPAQIECLLGCRRKSLPGSDPNVCRAQCGLPARSGPRRRPGQSGRPSSGPRSTPQRSTPAERATPQRPATERRPAPEQRAPPRQQTAPQTTSTPKTTRSKQPRRGRKCAV